MKVKNMPKDIITIKFSHHYKKMPPVLSGTYIKGVYVCEYANLSPDQIADDTETDDGRHYQLPQSRLICIDFWSEYGTWSTMRRFTPEKYKYYLEHLGQEVNIAIVPDPTVKLI